MNSMSLIIILILSCFETDVNDGKVKIVFEEFQTAMISGDCKKITALSSFPIEGDVGLARLINSDESLEQMEKYNFQITEELLNQNCLLLDSIELEVLIRFNFSKQDQDNWVTYDDCVYKSYLYIAEDKSYFQWSVGCVDLINESIGEYSMIFTFKLIEGEYKLKQIYGIG